MGDGIRLGKATNEHLGHLAFWLAKRCPDLDNKSCERILRLEFPKRQSHRWFTIQRFEIYRRRADHLRERIGIKNDREAAEVLKRIDRKEHILKTVFVKALRSTTNQLDLTLNAHRVTKRRRVEIAKIKQAKHREAKMPKVVPSNYSGLELPPSIVNLLEILVDHGFTTKATGKAKTIQILRSGKQYGYLDSTVIRRKGVIGYHFGVPPFLTSTNYVPSGFKEKEFCRHYGCKTSEIRTDCDPRERRKHHSYLIITDATVAERVLLKDAGIELGFSADGGSQNGQEAPVAAQFGAGFGNPVENKLVDDAAIAAVRKRYERLGWTVSQQKPPGCGFDLECRKGPKIENVEVKGIRGTKQSFFITRNEVDSASTNPNFVLMVVTSALSTSPVLNQHLGAEFLQKFKLSVVQYQAALQT